MKIFKLLLDIVTLCLIAALIMIFSLKEAEESFPNSNYVLHITSWDRQFTKDEVYKKIESVAKKEHIKIYKSIPPSHHTNNKEVYSFSKTNENIPNYRLVKYSEILSKDIRGNYFIIGNNFNINYMNQQLQQKGVHSELYSINKVMLFLSVISDKGLIFPTGSLLLIYLFYYFHKTNMQYKSFAIKKLHGYSIRKIIFENARQSILYYGALSFISTFLLFIILSNRSLIGDISLFIFRFIVSVIALYIVLFIISLISYLLYIRLNISQTIKGKKPYHLIRTITVFSKLCITYMLIFLVIQNIGVYHSLAQIKETKTYWNKLDDYYCLEIAPFKYTESEIEDISKKLHRMINISEKRNHSLLIKNNNIYRPKHTNFTPDNGNVVFVNENFIHFYNDTLQNQFSNKTSSNTVELLLPPNTNHMKQQIHNSFKAWLSFQQNNSNQTKDIKLLSSNKNYEIYTFDTRSDLKNTFAHSPIIALVNAEDLGDNFYYAAVSQGSYLFKNEKMTNNYLNHYDLTNVISGITNYKSIVLNEYHDLNIKFLVIICSIMLSFLTLLLITIFDIHQYFNKNQKLLLIRKMHGFSLFKNHYLYLLWSNCIIIIVGLFALLTIQNMLVVPLFATLLCLQIFIQSLYIKKLEYTNFIKIKEL